MLRFFGHYLRGYLGWIAILLSIAALAGGFNGGTISRYRGRRK